MAKGKKVGSIYTEIRARLDKLDRDYRTAHTRSKSAARKIQSSIDKISFNKAADSYRRFQRLFAVGLAGYGIKSLATAALDVASSFEMMQIKLDALTGGRGSETLEWLNKMAIELPVNTRKAVDSFVMMQAMGLDPTREKMLTLIDTASILGQEAMPRVARALGQMATLGRLSAEELNQMSEAGINARKYLTEAFGMTVEELQKSQISIEKIIDAIWKGLDANYAGGAKAAMKSWQGMTLTFKSYMEEMARQVMDAGVFDELKTQLDEINTRMKAWLETNRELIASSVPVYIDKIKGSINRLYEILTYDPDIIQWGLVGLLIWGKKGAALLGGIAHLGNVIEIQAKAFKAWAQGQISFGDIASANYSELKKLVEGLDQYSDGLAQAHGNLNRMGDALQKSHGEAKKLSEVLGTDTAGGGNTGVDFATIKVDTRAADRAQIDSWRNLENMRLELHSRTLGALIHQEEQWVAAAEKVGKDSWLLKAERVAEVGAYAEKAGTAVKDTFEDAFTSAGYSMTNMLMEGQLNFKNFANSIIADFARMGIQKGISAIGTSIFAGLFGSAKGNVFDTGGATAFARGGVVSRPTVFPFAGGVGLMGEAGPEAVMPLTRTAGGELGVKADGAGGRGATYNITINAVDAVSVTELMYRTPEAVIGVVKNAIEGGDRSLIGLLKEVR